MPISLNILALLLCLVLALFWLFPSSMPKARASAITFVSLIGIFFFNPHSVYLVVLCTFIAYVTLRLALSKDIQWAPLLIFAPLIVLQFFEWSDLFSPVALSSPRLQNASELGLSFYSLKLYGSVRTAANTNVVQSPHNLLLSAIFLPSFASGPIDHAETFAYEKFATSFSIESFVKGLARLGIGLAYVFVIADWLANDGARMFIGRRLQNIDFDEMSTFDTWQATLLAFLRLFFEFAGFSGVAVGVALMLNFEITENFRAPFLSRNIQEFWQRWHVSLNKFIGKYLFRPAVRRTGKAPLSIFGAFVLIGLWHELTFSYLIWGVGHGAALAGYSIVSRRTRRKPAPYRDVLAWLSIAVTISYVSVMSTIANTPIGQVDNYIGALLPLDALFELVKV